MSNQSLRQRLRDLAGTRRKVRLTRSIPSEPRHNGFLLDVGRDLVVLQQFHDFYPEGYTALRVSDIVDIRSGEYERQWERMLEGEGTLERVGLHYHVELRDFSALLEGLRERGEKVIVECEDPDEPVEDFYIGQILSLGEEELTFANFDALGNWEEEPHVIRLGEVTQVQFDTPYVRTFSKYLNGPCPHAPLRRSDATGAASLGQDGR